MHELSIAMSLVDIAKQEVKKRGAGAITEIELELGEFCGLDFECFNFSLNAVLTGQGLANTKIVSNIIEAEMECTDCGVTFRPDSLFADCPTCESSNTRLLKGEELRIKSLVIDKDK